MTIYNEQGEEWIPNPRSKLLEKEESLFQKTREVCLILCSVPMTKILSVSEP